MICVNHPSLFFPHSFFLFFFSVGFFFLGEAGNGCAIYILLHPYLLTSCCMLDIFFSLFFFLKLLVAFFVSFFNTSFRHLIY